MRSALKFIALTVSAAIVAVGLVVVTEKIAQARDSSFVGWLEVRTTFGTGSGCATATGAGDICADDAIEAGAAGFAGANAETITNATDGSWTFTSVGDVNNEAMRIDLDSTANEVELTSTTGVVTFDFALLLPISTGTAALGWTVVAGANTICNTTCVHACVFGVNTAATEADIVGCADATADECLCAGPT